MFFIDYEAVNYGLKTILTAPSGTLCARVCIPLTVFLQHVRESDDRVSSNRNSQIEFAGFIDKAPSKRTLRLAYQKSPH
jgi:hypothetical protein